MSTKFQPLEIPPGVVAMATKKQRSSNWSEVNLIRWREGQLMPVGGQVQYAYSFNFASRCKKIHGWFDLNSNYHIAYLCEKNLYVDNGGVLIDITPLNGMLAPSFGSGGYGDGVYGGPQVLATAAFTASSPNITMTPNPGAVFPGDAVYDVTTSQPLGHVLTYVGTSLVLTANALSASSGSNDLLSFRAYGDPIALTGSFQLDKVPDAFSLDNFGSILLAMTSPDGRLLSWDPGATSAGAIVSVAATAAFTTTSPNITMATNPGTVAPGMSVYDTTNSQFIGTVLTYVGTALVLTANALHASAGATDMLKFGGVAQPVVAASGRGIVPTGRCFVVTPERFVLVFGAQDATNGGGFRRFAWCDQENFTAWDYSSVTSQAGFLDIEPSSPIICAISSRTGTLFWTGKKAYRSRFLSLPYVYNYEELADSTTPWSPQSMTTTASMVVWMSEQGAFSFDGTSIAPVACKVRAWVDGDIDILSVREQSFAVHVENFNEIWWFFPQNGQPYNTRCIIYNYKEGWWSQGTMSRSAGITGAYNAHTVMADGLIAFQHELYATYVHAALPFAETFDLNLDSGSRLTTVKQLIPDVEGDISKLQYSIFYRNSRSLGAAEIQSAPVGVRSDGYVDFRVTGRDVRLRIDLGQPVNPVTLGQHLIDSVSRGDR